MTLRLRLALGLSALVVAAAALFGVFVHQTVYRIARDELQQRLAEESRAILDRFGSSRRGLVLPGEATARLEFFAQARDAAGSPTVIAPDLTAVSRPLPISPDGATAVLRGRPWSELVTVDNASLLVHTEPVVDGNSVIGVVQIARSFEGEEATLGALNGQLAMGLVILTIVAFGLFWSAMGVSLRPLERLTVAVEGLRNRREFGRRLKAVYADGEAGRLAMAIDGLIAEADGAYTRARANLTDQQRLFAQVAHELRAPLTAIRGNLGLLQRGAIVPDADRAEILRDAIDEAERLTRLVNELALMSRASAPQGMRLEPLHLRDLVFDVARKARMLAPERRLIADAVDDAMALANRDAIIQTLIILIENAAKFTPPGGTIGLQLRRAAGATELVVRDNGVGIAPEVLPAIFEPYNSGDAARNPDGLGLGLAIARQLIEAQGGTIRVESERGKGSTFTLALPADPAGPEPI